MHLAGRSIDDLGGSAEIDAHRKYRALFDDDALGHLGARADEAVVFDYNGRSLQRLQHSPDAGAAGDMAVPADLRARTHGGPGIDHGAAVDAGTDIDETRHEHDARRDVGGAAYDAVGDSAEPRCLEAIGAPAREFRWHLVVPCGLARTFEPAATWNGGGIVETEGEQHGLLEPLLRLPSAIPFLGHAQFTLVE